MSAVCYRETIWSGLFPGNRHTVSCLRPAVQGKQRQRTVWRLDGGAGSDEQLRWLLARDDHLVAKGTSNRRAEALASQVRRWDAYQHVWPDQVKLPVDYGRPVQVFIKKRLKADKYLHSYAGYDRRGGAEVEQFRNDKSGLGLQARRKRSFLGQQGYILLTDLAHNLLADFYHSALLGGPFAGYGPKRIVRDLLAMPGRLVFDGNRLARVELLSLKLFASDLAICLERYCLDR